MTSSSKPVRVLFVCLGNICRSPLAEGAFRAEVYRHNLQDRFEINSAGTGSWHIGDPPHRNARIVAKENGFSIDDFTGRAMAKEDFEHFDYIIAMDHQNVQDLAAMASSTTSATASSEAAHKIALLMSFAPEAEGAKTLSEIPDPYGQDIASYRATLKLCEEGVQGLLTHIRCNDLV
jgi:low molecular weight protein-tyrosine phosphatase